MASRDARSKLRAMAPTVRARIARQLRFWADRVSPETAFRRTDFKLSHTPDAMPYAYLDWGGHGPGPHLWCLTHERDSSWDEYHQVHPKETYSGA